MWTLVFMMIKEIEILHCSSIFFYTNYLRQLICEILTSAILNVIHCLYWISKFNLKTNSSWFYSSVVSFFLISEKKTLRHAVTCFDQKDHSGKPNKNCALTCTWSRLVDQSILYWNKIKSPPKQCCQSSCTWFLASLAQCSLSVRTKIM